MTTRGRRPGPDELAASVGERVPDVIAPGLRILFCGINPGLYSAAVGHHFARPGNRFWRALYESGFTDRLLAPDEEHELLRYGCGVTNVVARATAAASELSAEELREGARALEQKLRRYRPRILAVLGIGAYRTAFGQGGAKPGPQPEPWEGSTVWVLPNPSGLNAHYKPADFAALFRSLREAAEG